MSIIKLLLLGPAELGLNGQPVDLKSAKAMALLAYLAVTGGPQSRDHLVDLLWPDSLPEAARKNLRNTLWHIRKQLGDDVFTADADWIALAPAVELDLREFEQARPTLPAALNLYRGPLLDGVAVADAPDFELWLATERERLGQLYLRQLETHLAAQRANGDWPGMLATARRALAADNLQEPMHRAVMEAHARLGERADALRQFDALKNTLAQELGVSPLPETERLRAAIINGSLPQPEAVAPTPIPRPPAPKPATPFVGRQPELAALHEQFQLAGQGQARVTLITGELGIGKTRLWQEWSASLPPAGATLEARCLNTTQLLPFAPLTGLFGQSVCLSRLLGLSPIWLAELSRLLPQLRQAAPELPQLPALPPAEEHQRLFEALVQVLRAFNGQPLVLFVDDLHWIDQATLDWLVYLVDRMQREPLLLVGTYRPSDAPPQLSQVTAGWNRAGRLLRLPLARFTPTETAALLSALGRTQQVDRLQQQSAGNPYFLLELSHGEADDTPPELAELVRARLDRLPDAARQVLQAAAILDNNVDFATLRRTSGRGEEETITALEVLLDHNLLTERPTGYEFTHPLVAQVVRHSLSLARRSFLHRRAAQALEAVFADRLDALAGQLAYHYGQAGQPGKAARLAEVAADQAVKLNALTEAGKFYRQALMLEPTPEHRLKLGEVMLMQGQPAEGRDLLRQAAGEFEKSANKLGVAQAYLSLSLSFMNSGQGHEVVHWAELALAQLESPQNPEALARVHHALAAGGTLAGTPLAQTQQHLQEAIRLGTEHNLPGLTGIGKFELGNLLAQQGNLAAAIDSFQAALELAQIDGNLFQMVLAHNNLAYHLTLTGEFETARRHIETGLELAETYALFSPRQYLYSTRGEVALAAGETDQAQSWFERALREAQRNHNQVQAANIQANLGLVARRRGQLDEALLLLEAARGAAAVFTAPHLQTQIDLWLAELYVQRGEHAAARAALTQAEARLAGSERAGLQVWARQIRATLAGGNK